MSDREMLEDVSCPSCGSPLVSLDFDAADDTIGRSRRRKIDGCVWMIVAFVVISAVLFVGNVWEFRRDGAPAIEWAKLIVSVVFVLYLVRLVLPGMLGEWWASRTSRAGRLVVCHACGHAWRLPDIY